MEATQPIYHWGAIEALRKLGYTQERVAKRQAVLVYAELASQLRTDYFSLIISSVEGVNLAKKAEFAKRRADKLGARAKQGEVLAGEQEGGKLALESLELKREYFTNALEKRFNDFKSRSGYLDLQLADLPKDIVVPEVDQDRLREMREKFTRTGFKESPPTKLADEQQKAISHQMVINDAKSKPTFNLGAGVTQGPYINDSTRAVELQTIFFAGLTGNWKLFDRNESRETERALLVRRRLVDTELKIARDRLFNDASAYLDQLDISLRAIKLRQSLCAVLRENLNAAQRRFSRGQVDQTSVDKAHEELLDAELELLKDKASATSAYFAFLSTVFDDPAVGYYAGLQRQHGENGEE